MVTLDAKNRCSSQVMRSVAAERRNHRYGNQLRDFLAGDGSLLLNIVGKYGIPVQNALKKLAGVELDYICSTHGPVWHEHIEKVIGMYENMLSTRRSRAVICDDHVRQY